MLPPKSEKDRARRYKTQTQLAVKYHMVVCSRCRDRQNTWFCARGRFLQLRADIYQHVTPELAAWVASRDQVLQWGKQTKM